MVCPASCWDLAAGSSLWLQWPLGRPEQLQAPPSFTIVAIVDEGGAGPRVSLGKFRSV